MAYDLVLENVAAYSAQVLALIALAALLPPLTGLRVAKARLALYHAVLVLFLLLPVIEPWRQPVIDAEVSEATPLPAGTPVKVRGHAAWSREEIALAVIAAGILLRGAWLAAGLARLRRYRKTAETIAPLPDTVTAMRRLVGAQAEVALSGEIAGPVTFGFLRPIVLLPEGFFALPAAAQEAVACHEFLHVRRRDWLLGAAEELVSILFWFHPGVWWLIGQIRLAREQAVDHEVVQLTQARSEYVEALLAIAEGGVQPDLEPAPLFLQRRHLKQRVTSLLKERTMSKRHLAASMFSIFALLGGAGWLVVGQFPLTASPQVRRPDAAGVKVESGSAPLLHREPIDYPADAVAKRVEGSVVLEATLSDDGTVVDAVVLNGPEELRSAALQSVLNWHYAKTASTPRKVNISVDFKLADVVPAANNELAPPAREGLTLKTIDVGSLPQTLQDAVQTKLAEFKEKPFNNDLMAQVTKAALAVDSHLSLTWIPGAVTVRLREPQIGPPATPQDAFASIAVADGTRRIRVGGNEAALNLLEKKTPAYPPLAKQARIQGTVRFNVLIGTDGHIKSMQLVSGHPLLVPSATEAVQQWVYRPTLLNGNPVEVTTQIDVNYTLTQ